MISDFCAFSSLTTITEITLQQNDTGRLFLSWTNESLPREFRAAALNAIEVQVCLSFPLQLSSNWSRAQCGATWEGFCQNGLKLTVLHLKHSQRLTVHFIIFTFSEELMITQKSAMTDGKTFNFGLKNRHARFIRKKKFYYLARKKKIIPKKKHRWEEVRKTEAAKTRLL